MSAGIDNTVYVVTGANRGLGLDFVQSLLTRPQHTVVATVRSEQAKHVLEDEIKSISKGTGSKLEVTQYDFSTAIDPKEVESNESTAKDLRAAFETNTIAPLLVFQGLKQYLLRANSIPKLIWVTSSVESIADMGPFGGGAYGPSRAAQNWLARSIHLEYNGTKGNTRLIVIPLHPGWVQTRAGQFVVDQWQSALKAINYEMESPPTTLEESVCGMIKVIDNATAEHSGQVLTYEGKMLPW
ncbi:hypothetical protein J4E85_011134 [Alternaria conjuncta]|uniref:uncharacterized protein n=1 Tax=Alternaria conjuncta TaxID=181017 RepID=UPI00221E76C1|nr:uncharacterized protein J4E85_011134 [Alternaria conjuncta]KAI4911465.1 hypothetical protein J4E85_011134 [Alternaria conjuncta]